MEMSSLHAKASYHNVRIFIIVTLAVTLCYPALIDTAVIPSEKQVQNFTNFTTLRIPRATTEDSTEENTKQPKRICHNLACGWAVYNPHTRNIEYFMKSTCDCPDISYRCVRVGEDLSASAYVYRCRQNTTAEVFIESPETF